MPQTDSGFLVGGVRLLPLHSDITQLQADAVVQTGGTSMGKAIHVSSWVSQAGNTEIADVLSRYAPMQLGDVIVTHAGPLPARYLFTAVVLDWGHQHPADRLIVDDVITSAAQRCIHLATALGLKSLAFAPWGTRVSDQQASKITALMLNGIVSQILDNSGSLEQVYLVSNRQEHYQWFVDRAFVFEMLLGQVSQISKALDALDIPAAQREQLHTVLDHMRHNVVIYNEIVSGDKTTVGNIVGSGGIAIGKEAEAKLKVTGGTGET